MSIRGLCRGLLRGLGRQSGRSTPPPSLVAATAAASADANTLTTSAINTTGATLLYLAVPHYSGTSPITTSSFTDSKGNTWTALTRAVGSGTNTGGDMSHFYCANPIVGSGHTVSIVQAATFPGMMFAAFSGIKLASPKDKDSEFGNNTTGSTTIQPGSITPSINGCLVIASADGAPFGSSGTPITGLSVDGGFTVATSTQAVGGAGFGGALAYLVQTAAAAANPTFSAPSADWRAATIVSFKPT